MNELQGETVFIIPPDKKFFTVGEIPKLLAAAKWPHREGRCVSYLTVLPYDARRTRMPEIADQEVLDAIWAAQKLPPPAFPLPESDWERYAEALEQEQEKLAWSVVPCWASDAMNQGILRAAGESEFRKGLREAIASGRVIVRNPVTHMAVTGPEAQFGNSGLLISREDLSTFARAAMLEVQEGPAEPSEAPPGASVDTSPSRTEPVASRKKRRDAIAIVIDDVVVQLKERGTRVTTSDVWDALMVLAKTDNRVDIATDRSGITWTRGNGKSATLTQSKLDDRLRAAGHI